MKQYIDKSDVVAEIKELIRANELYLSKPETDEIKFQKTGAYSVLNDLLHSLDTIEVKDVDLEKEMDKFYGVYRDKQGITRDIKNGEVCFDWKNDQLSNHEMRIAKHFFNLGLRAGGD